MFIDQSSYKWLKYCNIGYDYHWLYCRTMQTAVGVFGGEGYMDRNDVPPLMVANAGKSSHPAISSLNCPPFIAVELCRERLIESDADILWKPGPREKDEQLAARGMKFLNWLWTRPEKEIVVVTHSAFLVETLSAFGNDCHPSIKSEICKSSSQTFKEIGGKWGLYIQLDENTLRGKSYEKGRVLIATEQVQKDLEAKEEDDDMAQNNNDLEDGFDGMEVTNDVVEASKAKNNTEKEFEPDPPNQFFVECQLEQHGESKRRVEDDQYSQVSKSTHLMEVETSDDCNGWYFGASDWLQISGIVCAWGVSVIVSFGREIVCDEVNLEVWGDWGAILFGFWMFGKFLCLLSPCTALRLLKMIVKHFAAVKLLFRVITATFFGSMLLYLVMLNSMVKVANSFLRNIVAEFGFPTAAATEFATDEVSGMLLLLMEFWPLKFLGNIWF
ncbi:hypothetical protein Vadar_017039 [Vaccinium darrowii]|uniref:Uncharacterized protein n=1 Tax=Vaccinium darrowii TaxID=229202 RepID=A0ACB7Y8M6_9ERIC|nr:hypothetical protein Vadar_017039 [Vaccinium darrowii]